MSDDLVDFNYQQSAGPRKRSVPVYAEITAGVKVISTVAGVVLLFGIVGGLGGLLISIGILITATQHGQSATAALILTVPTFGGSIIFFVVCYAQYALLRLIGACATAIRDIARNSFR
jgi:hypothetical protein